MVIASAEEQTYTIYYYLSEFVIDNLWENGSVEEAYTGCLEHNPECRKNLVIAGFETFRENLVARIATHKLPKEERDRLHNTSSKFCERAYNDHDVYTPELTRALIEEAQALLNEIGDELSMVCW